MSKFWLGPYVRQDDVYTAPGNGNGGLSLCTQEHDAAIGGDSFGLGVFWTKGELGQDWLSLGDGDPREIRPDETTRESWASLVGHSPQGDTLADWLFDQLTRGSDPARELAVAPLQPCHDGRLELVLSGVRVKQRKFTWGDPYTNRLRDLKRRHLKQYREDALAGRAINGRTKQVDRDWHRRCLKAMCEKYGCDWADLKPADWSADETPLAHDTTITDDFTAADDTALESYSGAGFSWNCTASRFKITSNKLNYYTGTGSRHARAESDLATDDHYSQITWTDYTDGSDHRAGGSTRMSSSTMTGYATNPRVDGSPDTFWIGRFTAINAAPLVLNVNSNCPMSANDVVRTVSDGSTQTGYVNGVSKASGTDTTYSGGTRCGFYMLKAFSGDSVKLDNFQAGDWPIATGTPGNLLLLGVG